MTEWYSKWSIYFIGAVKVWDPRQKNDPVATMEPGEGETKRDCWTVAFGMPFIETAKNLVHRSFLTIQDMVVFHFSKKQIFIAKSFTYKMERIIWISFYFLRTCLQQTWQMCSCWIWQWWHQAVWSEEHVSSMGNKYQEWSEFFLLCLAITFHILYCIPSLPVHVLVFKTFVWSAIYFYTSIYLLTEILRLSCFLTHLNCWNNQFLDLLFISAYTCTAYFFYSILFFSQTNWSISS